MRRLSTTIRAVGSVVFLSIALCGTSLAQTAGDPLDADAKADAEAAGFFTKGKAAFSAQKYDDAYKAFQEAWARKKTYDIAGNLAQVELKLGKLRDAAEHLQYAVKNFPLSGDQNQKAVMQKHLEATRSHFHALTLDIAVPGAQIYIDGILVGTAPHDAFFLDAGTIDQPIRRIIEVKYPGYEVWRGRAVSLQGSQEYKRVDLKPIAEAPSKAVAAVPPVPLDAPQRPHADQPQTPQGESKLPVRKIVIGAGAGTSVVLLATGVAFTIIANQRASEANALLASLKKSTPGVPPCPPGKNSPDCDKLFEHRGHQTDAANTAISTYLVGGVIGAGTLIYAIVGMKRHPSTSLQPVPLIGAGNAGLMVRGQW